MHPNELLTFLTTAERLKTELRHARTSAGRGESVAEHSWMACLLALLLVDQLETPVDRCRVLQMLVVHDLAEAITGDIPTFEKQAFAAAAQQAEEEALADMVADLPPDLGRHIVELCAEYQETATPEAKLARAVDKLEAFIQHNVAGIHTWDENDFNIQTDPDHPVNRYFDFDPYLQALRAAIDDDTLTQLTTAGELHRAHPAFNGK